MSEAPVPITDVFGGSEVSLLEDPYAVYRRLRREQPVCAVQTMTDVAHLVTRHDDVREALRNDEVFSNRSNSRLIGLVMGRTVVEMDGTEHLRHRALITPALAPRALRGDFPRRVAEIAHEIIDGFAGKGRADLVAEFTFSYPLRVFNEILGLPLEDYETIHRKAIELTHIGRDPVTGLAASEFFKTYLAPIVKQRRREEPSDLIGRLVHAEVEGERLSDDDVISFCRLLVIAGAETTYHMMGSALYGLLTRPEQLDEVRAERGLLQATMDETLRWESPVQIVTRETLCPTEIAGTALPEAANLILCIGSANRDDRVYDEPDRFDIHRDPSEHLAFGFGKHYCAGSRLAYLEAETGLDALLERLPNLRLDPGEQSGIVGMAFRGPERLSVLFG